MMHLLYLKILSSSINYFNYKFWAPYFKQDVWQIWYYTMWKSKNCMKKWVFWPREDSEDTWTVFNCEEVAYKFTLYHSRKLNLKHLLLKPEVRWRQFCYSRKNSNNSSCSNSTTLHFCNSLLYFSTSQNTNFHLILGIKKKKNPQVFPSYNLGNWVSQSLAKMLGKPRLEVPNLMD